MRERQEEDKLFFLNKKETKPILEALERQWGFTGDLPYVFVKNTQNNIYLCNRELAEINIDDMRLNNIGMYFCEIQKRGDVRLSIEGSQLIGPKATKNILVLDDKEADLWMKGFELDKETPLQGFVIVRHKEDFMGCGQCVRGKILNYVPKVRRIHATVNRIEDISEVEE